ncbi:hypothetical protein OsI_24901 [Oryza sativa Indica Group]|uniref:Uncharacterized protein n=1 Tax=Oryza sativa subsp. indica TaxID=39946 RepID=B8B7B2_ORYSI|nr:hypothetical protein OsI_24901 [Oryza sativa Indica Group]
METAAAAAAVMVVKVCDHDGAQGTVLSTAAGAAAAHASGESCNCRCVGCLATSSPPCHCFSSRSAVCPWDFSSGDRRGGSELSPPPRSSSPLSLNIFFLSQFDGRGSGRGKGSPWAEFLPQLAVAELGSWAADDVLFFGRVDVCRWR